MEPVQYNDNTGAHGVLCQHAVAVGRLLLCQERMC